MSSRRRCSKTRGFTGARPTRTESSLTPRLRYLLIPRGSYICLSVRAWMLIPEVPRAQSRALTSSFLGAPVVGTIDSSFRYPLANKHGTAVGRPLRRDVWRKSLGIGQSEQFANLASIDSDEGQRGRPRPSHTSHGSHKERSVRRHTEEAKPTPCDIALASGRQLPFHERPVVHVRRRASPVVHWLSSGDHCG